MLSFDVSSLQCLLNSMFKDVAWVMVALAVAVVLLTTVIIFICKHKTSSVETIILCTISESQLQEGRYVIQIDVFPKEKAGDKLKERKKKGFINKASSFIGGGKSAIFKVKRGSVITFETDGALQPMTKFKEGQNKLKCTNIRKEEISRQIHLVPNESSLEDRAAITFYHDGEFLNQITITDIPREETAVKGLMSVRSNISSSSGSAVSTGVEVLPLPPRSPPGQGPNDDVFSVRTGQRDDDDDDDDDHDGGDGNIRRRNASSQSLEAAGSSSLGLEQTTNIARGVFSNKSLETLSDALGPIDGKKLLKQLNMTDAEIKFELDNHPHDSGCAYANLFNKWRNKEIHRGEIFMREALNKGLERIHRNDIRGVFRKCATENAELTADDLRGIIG